MGVPSDRWAGLTDGAEHMHMSWGRLPPLGAHKVMARFGGLQRAQSGKALAHRLMWRVMSDT